MFLSKLAKWGFILGLVAVVGCGSEETTDEADPVEETPSGKTTLTVTFTGGVANSAELDNEGVLTGLIMCGLYVPEDMGPMAPNDDAEAKGSIAIPAADLSADGASITADPLELPAGTYHLGCFMDLDNNIDQNAPSPTCGDALVMPALTKATLEEGKDTALAATFSLAHGSLSGCDTDNDPPANE